MVIPGESKTVEILKIGRFVKKIFKFKVGGISLDTLYCYLRREKSTLEIVRSKMLNAKCLMASDIV